MCFALFRIGALPVFALPSHRSSEISYFVSLVRQVRTLFQIRLLVLIIEN